MLGDVDNNKQITAADARLCLRRAVNLENYEKGSREYVACDVDKDGNEEGKAAITQVSYDRRAIGKCILWAAPPVLTLLIGLGHILKKRNKNGRKQEVP